MRTDRNFVTRWADRDELQAVLQIHKTRKSTLGFLPDQPFVDAIDRGQVMLALEPTGRVVGYLLFRLRKTRQDAAIVHLAVLHEYERRGVARLLVEAIKVELAALRKLTLRCRRDYAEHALWPELGFEAVAERVGRSVHGNPVTVFELRLTPAISLFDHFRESSTPFAIDLNILLDLATDREQGRLTREILRQLDQFEVHPVRLVCLSNELNDSSTPEWRAEGRKIASLFAESGVAGESLRLDELSALIPRVDRADLRYVNEAEANGINTVLSRDNGFIDVMRSVDPSVTSVKVLHPAAFIDGLLAGGSPTYLPNSARGLRFGHASARAPTELARLFINTGSGERLTDFRRRIETVMADGGTSVLLAIRSDEPLCLVALAGDGEVSLLRSRSTQGLTAARHALVEVRALMLKERDVVSLTCTDSEIQPAVERALALEGFVPGARGWTAIAVDGVRTSSSSLELLRPFLDGDHSTVAAACISALERAGESGEDAAEAERLLDPLQLVDSALPAVLIPIQAQWSDRLIGPSRSQLRLELADALRGGVREHVYFRSHRGLAIQSPARIFWYRTGEVPSRIFAVSVLEHVVIAGGPHLWGRFGDYGVLSREDLESVMGSSERGMALKFVRTRILQREFTLAEVAVAAAQRDLTRPYPPQGPSRFDPKLASWVLSSQDGRG